MRIHNRKLLRLKERMLRKTQRKQHTPQHPDITLEIHRELQILIYHFRRAVHQSRVPFKHFHLLSNFLLTRFFIVKRISRARSKIRKLENTIQLQYIFYL